MTSPTSATEPPGAGCAFPQAACSLSASASVAPARECSAGLLLLLLPLGALHRELADEAHVHHAPVLRQEAEHVVGDVARVGHERERVRVGEDDRRLRDPQDVAHHVRAHVRDVDEHPGPVELPDEQLAVLGQPVLPGRVGGRVRPLHVPPVGERQVARAQPVEDADHRRRALASCDPLDAEERGDPPGAG